jgi:tol-pal system protein YbgF
MTLLLLACVLDRTGQSASASYEREMALAQTRTEALQSENANLEARIDQLEEVNRYRGQQEAAKMENLDQVREEVQRLRGVVEELQHEAELGADDALAVNEDVAFRLQYAEARLASLESTLGLEPPTPDDGTPPSEIKDSGEVVLTEGDVVETQLPEGAEDLMVAAEKHMLEDRPKVARTYYERFLNEHPEHERAAEAAYRLAETYFNDSDYKKAILRFEDVVAGHPSSQWAPWAMVRQGECFQMMGKTSEAELFWQDVVDRYPKTKAAKEAKALLAG